MKRSTLILLILFLASGAATLWFLNQPEEASSTLVEAESDFAVKDVDQIGKIFLASRVRGTQMTLTRTEEDKWMIDDTVKAHPLVMESLLEAVKSLRIKYRPSQAALENIVKSIATDQVKTEIYDRSGNLIKSYYVGGETADARGTYMIMEGSNKPFIMEIPSMSGSVKSRYDLSRLMAQERALFRNDEDNVAYISIEYPTRKNQSFILDMREGEPRVEPFYETTARINKQVAPGRVERYTEVFDLIAAEVLAKNKEGRDRFKEAVPFADIQVKFKDGTDKHIVMYPLQSEDLFTGEPLERIEKFNTVVDDDFSFVYIMQLGVCKKMFLGYPSFFE